MKTKFLLISQKCVICERPEIYVREISETIFSEYVKTEVHEEGYLINTALDLWYVTYFNLYSSLFSSFFLCAHYPTTTSTTTTATKTTTTTGNNLTCLLLGIIKKTFTFFLHSSSLASSSKLVTCVYMFVCSIFLRV